MADFPRQELTRSPQVNDLLREARSVSDGTADGAALKAAAKNVDALLWQMQAVFQGQSRFRERTPLFVDKSVAIARDFKDIGDALARVYAHSKTALAGSPVPPSLGVDADRVRELFERLMGDFDALAKEEQGFPVHSKSMFMNRVMRIAHGHAKGLIGDDALRDTVAEMLNHQRGFMASFSKMEPTSAQAPVLEIRGAEIKTLCARIEKGLQEASRLVAAGEGRRVAQVLEDACQATDRLAEIQDEFREADEAQRYRPCFRCGGRNEKSQRHCVKCGAFMPPLPPASDDDSSVDLQVEEQVRQGGHVQTELTQRMANAVRDVQKGKLSVKAFEAVLDELDRKVESARREFERLSVPSEVADEERAALEQTGDMLRAGIADVEEGLREMRVYLLDTNAAHLDTGLAMALRGTDKVFAVQMAARAAKQQSG